MRAAAQEAATTSAAHAARSASPSASLGTPVLEAVDLGGERGGRPLFRALRFALRPGQVVWLRGRNGRGKTSLLRLMAGLATPVAGAVQCDGVPLPRAGAAYSLQLQGLPVPLADGPVAPRLPGRPDGHRPLIEQASQGQLDPNGLAPDRFTDRRGGRGQRAANFRRELGRIEFSGPSTVQPAWPGAQDRLSWWVQLPAIVAAAASVPAQVRLFVVDARGRGELWRFDYLGLAAGPAGSGRVAVQHWQHEPAQAESQRVELWLDPAQGHWPVQLRLTSLRTGERFELQLLAIEPSPPSAP